MQPLCFYHALLIGTSTGDLTGTAIVSDKLLTVISGHECGTLSDELNDSLFSYSFPNSWPTYYDPTFTPVYEPVFNDATLEEKANEICGNDEFCKFDIAATGSTEVGEATYNGGKMFEEIVNLSQPSE